MTRFFLKLRMPFLILVATFALYGLGECSGVLSSLRAEQALCDDPPSLEVAAECDENRDPGPYR